MSSRASLVVLVSSLTTILACSSSSGGDAPAGAAGASAGGSGGDTGTGGAGGGAGFGGSGGIGVGGAAGSGGDGAGGSGAPSTVTFRYRPSWSGVTSVTVIGGFGTASDWMAMQPLVALADDGSGTFVGSADLPAGKYPYVLRIVGDAQAAMPATSARYAIDPANPAFVACPLESPTFAKDAPNPCSELSVPQATPASIQHVKGAVTVAGQAPDGYMVVLERDEPSSHHFFADRVTVGADGAFDLAAAAGRYRLQIWHPTFLTTNDKKRDPLKEKALRRAISGPIDLSAEVAAQTPDMAYGEYLAFAPSGMQMLPTHFTFGTNGGAATRLDVYSGGNAGVIGDPWFASKMPTTKGAADFDGTFDTAKATDPIAKPGTEYFWGTEQQVMAGTVAWTAQTMVFPIVWK